MDTDFLAAAARSVDAQASEFSFGIPVDPDVADYMGAFPERALGLDDLDDPQNVEAEDGHGR